jgi:hypothetical protein
MIITLIFRSFPISKILDFNWIKGQKCRRTISTKKILSALRLSCGINHRVALTHKTFFLSQSTRRSEIFMWRELETASEALKIQYGQFEKNRKGFGIRSAPLPGQSYLFCCAVGVQQQADNFVSTSIFLSAFTMDGAKLSFFDSISCWVGSEEGLIESRNLLFFQIGH